MTEHKKNTKTKTGNLLLSIGVLFTILSLTIIEDSTWKINVAGVGLILALTGAILLPKKKKE